MTREGKIVFIVDDDDSVRAALCGLLGSLNLSPIGFESAEAYLAFQRPNLPSCLLLDVKLPGINGLDLQERIVDDAHPPIIFITGYADIPSCVRAMKAGAVDFLTKPFSGVQLIKAIDAAIDQDSRSRFQKVEQAMLRQHFCSLTPRERDVFLLVISGLLNKQAAAELGISEITYQIHRKKVMHKMKAASLADLVRIAGKLQIPVVRSRRGE